MKTILTLCLILASFSSVKSQCKDVYEKPCDCPTLEDSLILYINAISVVEFYDYNPSYKKTAGKDIRLDFEKREVFELMKQSRRLFSVIRREVSLIKEDPKFASVKPIKKYHDITFDMYYKVINKYRFQQRELENQIINRYAPFPIYDYRISPIFINEYRCTDSTSEFFGDIVNIPMYIPVVVKPDEMLSDSERNVRTEILKSFNVHELYLKMKENKLNALLNKVNNEMKDTTNKKIESYDIVNNNAELLENQEVKYATEYPVYYRHPNGGGSLIGFMIGRKFQKIQKRDYEAFAVPKYCRELLENDKNLIFYLKTMFGDYFDGIYKKKL